MEFRKPETGRGGGSSFRTTVLVSDVPALLSAHYLHQVGSDRVV